MSPDPFLSETMGIPAYRVVDAGGLSRSMFTGDTKSFAYAKVSTADVATVNLLERLGFGVVDAAVQLDCPATELQASVSVAGGYEVRLATAEDREGVEAVAAENFIYSRFHLDPEFPEAHANEFKRRWAGNFFSGQRGDAMVVAGNGCEVAGFLQLLKRDKTLIIDLIAVAKSHQRKGLAAAMVDFGGQHFSQVEKLLVGTQIANVPSVRAYQKLGFRVCGSSYVLHYHGPIDAAAATP